MLAYVQSVKQRIASGELPKPQRRPLDEWRAKLGKSPRR